MKGRKYTFKIPDSIVCDGPLNPDPRKLFPGVLEAMGQGGEVFVMVRPGSPNPVIVSVKARKALQNALPPSFPFPTLPFAPVDIEGWPERDSVWSYLVLGQGTPDGRPAHLFMTGLEPSGIHGRLVGNKITWQGGQVSSLRVGGWGSLPVVHDIVDWVPAPEVVANLAKRWAMPKAKISENRS